MPCHDSHNTASRSDLQSCYYSSMSNIDSEYCNTLVNMFTLLIIYCLMILREGVKVEMQDMDFCWHFHLFSL